MRRLTLPSTQLQRLLALAPIAIVCVAGLHALLFGTTDPSGGAGAASWGFWTAPWDHTSSAARPITVLQIGDSHTAADFFTGEVRRILQARYGNGGLGYLEVGRPHPGVQNVDVEASADAAWSYAGIQKSSNVDRFALTGFSATTAQPSARLNFTATDPTPYTDLEIEAMTGPDQGALDVMVDGQAVQHVSLEAPQSSREWIRLVSRPSSSRLRRISLTTTNGRPVTILSVDCFDRQEGLTYSNVGFPGATVDIVNRFPRATIVDALRHLKPNIVVLAFGTNEGFNDNLDLAGYRDEYEQVIRTIRTGSPDAHIVIVGPPYANRAPNWCHGGKNQGCPDAPTTAPKTTDAAPESVAAAADAGRPASSADAHCPWPTPPLLDRVRTQQAAIASLESIAYWDWSSIMPEHCGPDTWVTAVPRLMAPDHVHFTAEGYRRGGRAFADFLDPFVKTALREADAVSDN